jgi:hypothetical protein
MTETTIGSVTLSAERTALPDVIPLWIPAFFGDSNRTLKEAQQDSYTALVYALFDMARKRFLTEIGQPSPSLELCRRLRETVLPRPQSLTRVYRRLAAFYRYALDREPSARDEEAGLDRTQAGWEAFFQNEARFLVEDSETVRLALVAATGTAAEAVEAEDRLVEVLRERYGELTLRRRQEVLRLHPRRGDLASLLEAARRTRSGFAVNPQVRPNPPD